MSTIPRACSSSATETSETPMWRTLPSSCRSLKAPSGAADRRPDARALPGQAGLGRDDQALRVRVQRLGDEPLADLRAVGVGGVDEVHPLLDGGADDAAGVLGVGRLAPHA